MGLFFFHSPHFRNLTGKENGTLCLVEIGTILPETLEVLCKKAVEETKLSVCQVRETAVYEEKRAGQQLAEADAILLCLPEGKVTYGALENTLENMAVYEEKILGAILLQK